MDEMISYICTSLRRAECGQAHLQKLLRRQIKANKRLMIALWGVTAYAVFSEFRSSNRKLRIEDLKREIEDLKSSKGE